MTPSVPSVILRRTHAKVFPSVILGISILVVNLVANWNINSLHFENNQMDRVEARLLSEGAEPNVHIPLGTIRPTAFAASLFASKLSIPSIRFPLTHKMMDRPLVPSQNSAFRLVREALTQKFNARQFLARMTTQTYAGFSLMTHVVDGLQVRGSSWLLPAGALFI